MSSSVFVLPSRHLAAQHVAGLHHDWGVTGIAEVLGAGETRQASTGNGDAHNNGKNQ
jgi:hypothetical protein